MTTVDDNLNAALDAAAQLRRYDVSAQAYGNTAQAGILHALVALGLLLNGQEKAAQAIPGLPEGYKVTTEQAGAGDRKWRSTVTSPDGVAWVSRYKWGDSETALISGIRQARTHAETGEEPRP